MFEGRSRYSNLSPRGRPSGSLCAGEGPTTMILKRPVQLRESFSFGGFVIGAFAHSLSGCGGCVIYPYPASSNVFGSAQECVREGGVAPVDAGDCECVLFANELVGSLLSFTGEIAIGEMVTVKALVGSAVRAAEDGEEEAR